MPNQDWPLRQSGNGVAQVVNIVIEAGDGQEFMAFTLTMTAQAQGLAIKARSGQLRHDMAFPAGRRKKGAMHE